MHESPLEKVSSFKWGLKQLRRFGFKITSLKVILNRVGGVALFTPHTNETTDRKQEAREEQGNKPWGAAVAALPPTHKRTQEIKNCVGGATFGPLNRPY